MNNNKHIVLEAYEMIDDLENFRMMIYFVVCGLQEELKTKQIEPAMLDFLIHETGLVLKNNLTSLRAKLSEIE